MKMMMKMMRMVRGGASRWLEGLPRDQRLISRRIASFSAFAGMTTPACSRATSGSLRPWPVTVQTIREPSVKRVWENAASPESMVRKRPAMEAALAGSTKIPSFAASQRCAARISSSVTISTAPSECARASSASCQLAGLPMRMALATVSGFRKTR